MFKRGLAGFLIALCCCAVLAPLALAETNVGIGVASGPLTISEPSATDFSGITLDGTAQDAETTLGAFSVNDARGTGEGWHVVVQADPLREWDGSQYVGGGKALDAGSLEMSEPDVTPGADVTSPSPSVSAGPYTLDAGSAITIASAAANEGMGQYNFSPTTLRLILPPSIYAKTYRTTVTISVISGP